MIIIKTIIRVRRDHETIDQGVDDVIEKVQELDNLAGSLTECVTGPEFRAVREGSAKNNPYQYID